MIVSDGKRKTLESVKRKKEVGFNSNEEGHVREKIAEE